MDRRYWMGILFVIAVGAIIFSLAQNQTLNQTQSTLVAAQSTVTAQFDQMNEQATAAADAQQKAVMDAQSAAATALSMAVNDAQNAASTAQADVLKKAQDAYTTAQAQTRNDAAATLDAASTAQAGTLAAVQADAQSQADSAATAQANSAAQATALQSTITAQDAALTTAASALNTAQDAAAAAQSLADSNAATAQANASTAEANAAAAQANAQALSTAQAEVQFQANNAATAQALSSAEIEALNATIVALSAHAEVTPAASPTLPPNTAGGSVPSGWKRVEGRGVAVQLPESFDSLDLANLNPEALAQALENLGPEFASAATLVRQNPDLFRFIAFDKRSKSGLITNVGILAQDLPFGMPLKSLVDATVAQLPAAMQVTENTTVEINSRQVARLVTSNTLTTPPSMQLEYFFIENGRVYVVVFTTPQDEFENRLPVFEQIFMSMEILPGN